MVLAVSVTAPQEGFCLASTGKWLRPTHLTLFALILWNSLGFSQLKLQYLQSNVNSRKIILINRTGPQPNAVSGIGHRIYTPKKTGPQASSAALELHKSTCPLLHADPTVIYSDLGLIHRLSKADASSLRWIATEIITLLLYVTIKLTDEHI